MARVLVISDVHLKPTMFDRADKILESGQADIAIQMGDLVDDWDQQYNLGLYSHTLQRAIKFQKDHPNTLWVLGNHDLGYWYPTLGVTESGHSGIVEGEVGTWFREMRRKGAKQDVMHVIDGVVFTHAGLTKGWVDELIPDKFSEWKGTLENVQYITNQATPYELWRENSPIWVRPQQVHYEMYPAKLQVVGHTPMKTIEEENHILSTDVFSTYRDGRPIGTERFAIVDTEKGTWEVAMEPDHKRVIRNNPKLQMFIEFFEKELGTKFVDADTGETITVEKEGPEKKDSKDDPENIIRVLRR